MTGAHVRYDPLSTRDDDDKASPDSTTPCGPSPTYPGSPPGEAPSMSSAPAKPAVTRYLRPSLPPPASDADAQFAFYRAENDYLRHEYEVALAKIDELKERELARFKADLESKSEGIVWLCAFGGIFVLVVFACLVAALIETKK
ncbi:hypothetical protein JCM11491_004518 [Sporobolomyces phaffii]